MSKKNEALYNRVTDYKLSCRVTEEEKIAWKKVVKTNGEKSQDVLRKFVQDYIEKGGL